MSGVCEKSKTSKRPSNRERMAREDSSKSLKHGMTLLSHGGKRGANATKCSGSIGAAEGASNLLLNLRHSQVSLGEIVGPSAFCNCSPKFAFSAASSPSNSLIRLRARSSWWCKLAFSSFSDSFKTRERAVPAISSCNPPWAVTQREYFWEVLLLRF